MQSVVLSAVTVIDPESPWHLQTADVELREGRISRISAPEPGRAYESVDYVFDGRAAMVSPGWVAASVVLTEPGFEHKDTLETIAASAQAGGFTRVVGWPNTEPPLDSAGQIRAALQQGASLPVHLDVCGAASAGCAGKDLAEIGDLRDAGAVAWTDGLNPLQDAGQLMRTLRYLRFFEGLLVQLPFEQSVAGVGVANESAATVGLGLRTIPPLAEEMMVARCLQILAYTGGKLHFSPVTTAGAIRLISESKAAGLSVTADTAPHYLALNDGALADFEPNYKVMPPLKSEEDRRALVSAVLSGSVDCLAAHHFPQNFEEKEKEFDYAAFGMLSLETAFPLAYTELYKEQAFNLSSLVDQFSRRPRQIYNLPESVISEGNSAELTLFAINAPWTLEQSYIRSISRNTPFVGKTFHARAVGTFAKGVLRLQGNAPA